MLPPPAHFGFCPRCGHRAAARGGAPFRCHACGFLFHFNPAIAAAALVVGPDGQAVFIRRGKEPARGKLAFVGGFVDCGESAEVALRREVREEIGIELDTLEYLSSHPNDYHYHGIVYPVVDLCFVGHARDVSEARALDGVDGLVRLAPLDVDPASLAFPSMTVALRLYQAAAR